MDPETIAILGNLLDSKIGPLESSIVEKVTIAVTESVSDKISKTVDEKLGEMVAPINQRQDKFEARAEAQVAQIESLQQQISDLTGLVKGQQPLSNVQHVFPPLPQANQAPLHSPAAATLPVAKGAVNDTNNDNRELITNIVKKSKRVIGLEPITPENIEKQKVEPGEDALVKAVIEYLRMELNVRDTEIAEKDIESVFLPAKSDRSNCTKVYVRFNSEEQSSLCLNLAKSLKDSDIKISRYFPKQFNARLAALGRVAYKLRNSVPKFKTSIEYTDDDLVLLVCPQGKFSYQPYHVDHLPPIDLRPPRSPPVGRQKQNKRPRSASKSPVANETKKDRKDSPEKENSDASKDIVEVDLETSDKQCSPTNLSLRKNQDVGHFYNLQASSPMTGKVFFDLETAPSRRQSLNF